MAEARTYLADTSAGKFPDLVERLLASEEFGANWADYWSDTIAFHVPPPELTYLNYRPLKALAGREAQRQPAVGRSGSRADHRPRAKSTSSRRRRSSAITRPSATNLAAETSRIFLGQQIGCAECHDHPFDHWKRTQFHELAAFFARTKAKLPWNDGPGHRGLARPTRESICCPNVDDPRKKGTELRPALLDGKPAESTTKMRTADCPTASAAQLAALGHGPRQSLVRQGVCQPRLGPADRPRVLRAGRRPGQFAAGASCRRCTRRWPAISRPAALTSRICSGW